MNLVLVGRHSLDDLEKYATENFSGVENRNLPKVDFLVRCSKGTYIRSLAHDFGKSLSNGAHLSSLKRTRVGDYKIENAFSMESVINPASEKNITRK